MEESGIDVLLKALGDRAEASGIEQLNEDERTALVPYWAYGRIGNGGFRYFFEQSFPLADAARRFRRLGLLDIAAALERVVVALFPDGMERRLGVRLTTIDWETFRPELLIVLSLSWERLTTSIAEFVGTHPESFRRSVTLLPN
jgi:hypothetical protein